MNTNDLFFDDSCIKSVGTEGETLDYCQCDCA